MYSTPQLNDEWWRHWLDVHTREAPTLEWLLGFIDGLPNSQCGCRQWLMDYIVKNTPRFDDWPAWTWSLHNAVNEKLNKSQMSWLDFEACWLDIAPRTKNRLVISVATGPSYNDLLKLTKPSMQAYAERCNADLVCLTNQRFDQWQREKFRVYEFAQQYDETLFVDADCLVRTTTIDLFDDCKGHDVGMHDDLDRLPKTWVFMDEYSSVMKSQGLEATEPKSIWNSGIVYCTRDSSDIWKPPPLRLPDSHCSEQFWVHHQASKYRIKSLDSVNNWQYWFKGFADGVDRASVVHLANHPDKASGISQYLA